MPRTPDQDAVDGLSLAQGSYTHVIGQLEIDQWEGKLDLDVDTDSQFGTITVASLDPDAADSFARVLQAWAGRRREMDAKEGS